LHVITSIYQPSAPQKNSIKPAEIRGRVATFPIQTQEVDTMHFASALLHFGLIRNRYPNQITYFSLPQTILLRSNFPSLFLNLKQLKAIVYFVLKNK